MTNTYRSTTLERSVVSNRLLGVGAGGGGVGASISFKHAAKAYVLSGKKSLMKKKIFEINNTLKGNRNATLFECKLHWVVF